MRYMTQFAIIAATTVTIGMATATNGFAFNPQPEPPVATQAPPRAIWNPGGSVSFNPQLEPPVATQAPPRIFWNPGGAVSFNPQPEPPESISKSIR